jgi:DNA-binding transcriptional regulator YdaS (Cro superfamily)
MDLKAFLASLPDEAARKQFAADCGTSLGHMRNTVYEDGKRLAAPVCVRVERLSGHQVTRRELRDDWADIWPELVIDRHPALAAVAAQGA